MITGRGKRAAGSQGTIRRGIPGWLLAPAALALALLAPTCAARGEVHPETIKELSAPVQAGSKITYMKLVNAVFRGASGDAQGDGLLTASEKVLRRIGEKERTVLPEGTRLTGFEILRVRGDGKRYLVLAITVETDETDVIGGGAFVLADFPEGSAEPQDVAEVKGDRFCGLARDGIVLGPDDGFFVENYHSNSNQGYLITDLFHIHEGRLRRVDSLFTLSLNGMCRDSFEEVQSWKTEDDPPSPYPKVVVTVTLQMGPRVQERSDCPKTKKPAKPQVFTDTCRWDKAKGRYVSGEGNIDKLDDFNKNHV